MRTAAAPLAKCSKSSKSSSEQTITSSFRKMTPLPRTSERYKKLTKAVCYFICKDQQPFDTVNDVGFRHMLHVFESHYTPPDRTTIASKYAPTYTTLKEDVTKQLKDADYYCITKDMWSSRAKQSYIAITIHYLTDSFDMRSHLLRTKEFPEAHTSDMIVESLLQILMEWELDSDKLLAATTDNGSNIALALRKLGWSRISCFSHTLQLSVEKALSFAKAISRISQPF